MGLFKKAGRRSSKKVVRKCPYMQLDFFKDLNGGKIYVRSTKEETQVVSKEVSEVVFGRCAVDSSGECAQEPDAWWI